MFHLHIYQDAHVTQLVTSLETHSLHPRATTSRSRRIHTDAHSSLTTRDPSYLSYVFVMA